MFVPPVPMSPVLPLVLVPPVLVVDESVDGGGFEASCASAPLWPQPTLAKAASASPTQMAAAE
jgi:hypothetical protein